MARLVIGILHVALSSAAFAKPATLEHPAAAMKKTVTLFRPHDLLDNPSRYLDRVVEVTIVEPLEGPATKKLASKIEHLGPA